VFHDVRPVAPTDVAARVEALIEGACGRGAAIVVFPELSVDDVALARLRDVLARAPAPPALVVAGSRHVRAGGALRNIATLVTAAGDVTHAKFNPYFAGEQLEDIALVPAELRAHGLVDDAGRLVCSVVLAICKDFVAPGAQRALEVLRPTLVLVPAWSQKTAIFESDAVGLTGKTQAIVVIANQADPAAGSAEDPAVLVLTRPVPALGPVIVRRSEVTPPALVGARLDAE
jgi:predicted amidohydrolase